jgi:LPS O-antigen subunit length determinant protein (WzzB/FepE family)
MQSSSFNLVDIAGLLQKRWKAIGLFVSVTIIIATITVFLVPQYFRSTVTVVPANSVLADKARLFNNNIQNLYSYFGSGDDLDRISGIANMDTVYKTLVDEFSLVNYYKLDDDSMPLLRRKAVLYLRKDLSYQKTEEGQLKIIAWTKDRALSAAIANRAVALIQDIGGDVWRKNYNASLEKIDMAAGFMEQEYRQLSDSLSSMDGSSQQLAITRQQSLLEQIKQYRKTADEFKLAAATPPAVLYVMEPASPAAKAERPDKTNIVLAAMIAGFIFGCLLVIIYDRNQLVE